MKKLPIFIALTIVSVVITTVQAAFRFNIEEGFNWFNDDRVEGQNRHFDFLYDIGDDFGVGYLVENADLQVKGTVGAIPPNTTQLDYSAQGIRVMKNLFRWLAVGIDVGSVRIQQGPTSGAFAATGGLNQNKPFVGLNGVASYGTELSDKVSTDMHVLFGYRFLDMNDVTITGAPAGEPTLNDLNSFVLGVGFSFRF